jgi:hypothetical protein
MLNSAYCLLLMMLAQVTQADGPIIYAQAPSRSEKSAPSAEKPLIEKAIDGLSVLGDALTTKGQSTGAAKDDNRSEVPATPVWARVSRQFLAKQIERDVDRKKPVRDVILGTPIAGESHTTGKTRFVLYPNDHRAMGEVEFVGKVHAVTVGHNGPATLYYLSDSTFRAHKRLTVGEDGLSALSATALAPTHLTATNIGISLPGLRGRIAQRVAWRRVAKSQSAADAEVSDHTARDIRHDLDVKMNESIASMQDKVQAQLAKLQLADEHLVVRSRSTPDYVEVALCSDMASGEDFAIPSFSIEGNPEIAVRVHRTMLVRAMSDPQIRGMVAPFVGNAMKTWVAATPETANIPKTNLQVSNFSTGGEWTTLELRTSDEQVPQVAREEQANRKVTR